VSGIRRREFITLLGGTAAAWPLAAHAQQPAMPVIGYLHSGSPGPYAHLVATFHQGLKEAGAVEGKNFAIEYHWAEGRYDRLPALAADLVSRHVALIVAQGGDPPVLAAKSVTATTPVVFTSSSDPVKLGLVTSLNHPGGNVSDNMDLIRSAAVNLIELNPDVILAVGARVIPILMELTRSIPIVAPSGADPIARGYAESLAHPGGNVTGFATMELSIVGKMLQTLKEIAPDLAHVSLIYNPDNPAGAHFARSFESAAGPLGVEPIIAHIHGLEDIERGVAAAAAQPNSGIFVPLDITMNAWMEQTIAAIARHRLPTIYSERVFVTSGGLVSYGTNRIEMYRRAASYVDRILRGEKASELPYQQPTKYELVINLKTAKALGLTIPASLLFTADEVIE
jgi:putative ABC transport system substrate-binding protein